MMDAMTVEEKFGQLNMVASREAAKRIAFVERRSAFRARHAITRQVMALGSETTQA
jgi:hypothetical protein